MIEKHLSYALILSLVANTGTICAGTNNLDDNNQQDGKKSIDGMDTVFNWDGQKIQGLEKSARCIPVTAGSIIKANVFWRNLVLPPGAKVVPALVFESSRGVPVGSNGDTSKQKIPVPVAGTLFENCRLYPMAKIYPVPQQPEIMEAEEYFQVPDDAVQARFAFMFKGNQCRVELVNSKIAQVSELPKSKAVSRYPVLKYEGKMLTDVELNKYLSDSNMLCPRLETRGDTVLMSVNGNVITPKIFKTSSYCKNFDMIETFYRAGFNIFTVNIDLGVHGFGLNSVTNGIWKGHKNYDVALVREAIRQVLKRTPDAMIMLECSVTPCSDWGKNNPDEVFQHSDGRKGVFRGCRTINLTKEPPETSDTSQTAGFWHPSYYSEKYNLEVAEALFDIFAQINAMPESKKIIGVYLNGGTDGQWLDLFDAHVPGTQLVADYSPAALKSFRAYLKSKYNNDLENLRKTWNDNSVKAFDEISIPLPSEIWRKESEFHSRYSACKTSDYCEFLGYGNAMRHIKWCKAVKDATEGRLLTGSYCPHSGIDGYPLMSQQNAKWLLESKDVDFFAIVPGYDREYYDPVVLPVYNGSMLLHGKLLVSELDLRNPEVDNWGKWATDFWRRTHSADTYRNEVKKFVANSVTLGGTFHAYDMDNGWFNTSNAIETWKQGCSISDLASPALLTDKRIGVVASERFWDFQSFARQREMVYNVRVFPKYAFARSGIRHDYYLLSDVTDNKSFEAPKVLMFTDACTITTDQAGLIRQKFGNSGRILVWFWAPGIFAPGDERNLSKISGFNLERVSQADGKPIFANMQNDPLMLGVKGFLFPLVSNYDMALGPAWKVTDTEAKVLANYFGTDIPAMAVKRHDNFTEIYIGQPGSLTPQLVRNIALSAGITPTITTDDISGCGGNIFYLVALNSGTKTINLPEESGTVECLTGQNLTQAGNVVTVYVAVGDTMVLRLNPKRLNINEK